MSDHHLPKWALPSALALLGIAPPSIAIFFRESLTTYLSELSPSQLSTVTILLLGISTLSLAWCIYLRPWLKWDEPTGTWVSRLTAFRYCAKCRATKIITPLKNEVTGWRCMNCQHFYHDPARAHIESPKKKATKSDRI